jgi:hypothetical protein
MSDDVLKRAQRALQTAAARRLAAPDQAKGHQLLARAQAVIGVTPKQTLRAAPPPEPRVERVKLPVTCSVRGVSYVVIAERRGDELRFVGHESPQPGPRGASRLPGRLSGQYRIVDNGSACPLCANTAGVWLCDCAEMGGAMHCLGTVAGRYRCACGRIEEREFFSIETAEVRGASIASKPEKMRSNSAQGGRPQLKQMSHER